MVCNWSQKSPRRDVQPFPTKSGMSNLTDWCTDQQNHNQNFKCFKAISGDVTEQRQRRPASTLPHQNVCLLYIFTRWEEQLHGGKENGLPAIWIRRVQKLRKRNQWYQVNIIQTWSNLSLCIKTLKVLHQVPPHEHFSPSKVFLQCAHEYQNILYVDLVFKKPGDVET